MARSPLAAHSASPAELRERLLAERAGVPFLVLRDGANGQRIVRLTAAAAAVSIGRDPGNDVALPWDEQASRVHAVLERVGGAWALVDDGLSRNGSFVNGERVAGRRRLEDGDAVRLGRTVLVFRSPGAASRPTALPAADDALPDLPASQRRVLVALCRPYRDEARFASPATNEQIARELHLSVDTVKKHLRAIVHRLGLQDLPQNEKRRRLAERALSAGLVAPRDL